MFSTTPKARLSKNLAFSALLLLAACGGNSSPPPVTAPEPPAPAPQDPPAPPPPAPQPPPQTPPPVPDPVPVPDEGIVLASTYTDLVAGTINSQPNWPDWQNTGKTVPGVDCLVNEIYHIHALVSIYKDGVRLALPSDLGHKGGCTYELHTHDGTGILHVEANVQKTFTLGQFFRLWDQALGANGVAGLAGPVKFYLIDNEKLTPYSGDPANIELSVHREIVIITGTAPKELPKYRWPEGF
jgi:hypothetical protein